MAGIVDLLAAEGVDYVSLALGDSSTYLGSVGSCLRLPSRKRYRRARRPLRRSPPAIATSRIVDPEAADRLIAEGGAEAVGMTRALIADPEMPPKARSGQLEELVRWSAGAPHRALPRRHADRCAVNPVTGRELHLAARLRRVRGNGGRRRRRPGRPPRCGDAGRRARGDPARAHRAARRSDRAGGSRTRGGEPRRACSSQQRAAANDAGVELALGADATRPPCSSSHPDGVVVATGARPYRRRGT